MVSKIKIHERMLEDIVRAGKRAKAINENLEAMGLILSEYQPEDDFFLTLKRYNLGMKFISKRKFIEKLSMFIDYPLFIYIAFKFVSDYKKLTKIGKKIGIISYHIHACDQSWSEGDLKSLEYSLKNIPSIDLLYRVKIDKFEAINQEKKPVLIEVIDKQGNEIETFGDQTPEFNGGEYFIDKHCNYQVCIQLEDKSKRNAMISFNGMFNPGIANGAYYLIFNSFIEEMYKKLGLETFPFSKNQQIRHLEIKREDGIIIWKY